MRPAIEPTVPDSATMPPSPASTPQSPPPDAEPPPGEGTARPSNGDATAGNPLAGADVHVVHPDDGSAKVTASGVHTPAGPADVSASIDRDRRSASAETVFPDGRRVESRRTTPDGRTWSQIDTVRDARGTVRATLTTTFDGTHYSQTYAPADGEARTATWDAKRNPDSPVQKVSGDEPLRLFTMDMDSLGTGGIADGPAVGPAVLAGGMLGLALYALAGNSQDQGKPAPMEARRPREGDNEDDNDNTGGRKRRGHRDSPRPLLEGEVYRPPGQTSDPADSAKPKDEASSDESTPPQLTKPYKPPHELSDEEIDKDVEAIAKHSYGKHKEDQGEFSNVYNELELNRHVKNIIKEHKEWKPLSKGRTAYWDDESGTVVIHNPNEEDRGTVHQPKDGKKYYDGLDER
jgi:hypothetical protein